MNHLYYEDFFEGMQDRLEKKADNSLFTNPGNTSLFPTANTQAKWRYAKGDNFLRLHDGQKIYSFNLPKGFHSEEEFEARRQEDTEHSKFEEGATHKGFAQVHRSDPGSVYFTLQEGRENPTYTFKHKGEDEWRGIPKKRKKKEVVVPVNFQAVQEGVKAAFAEYSEAKKKESIKSAGIVEDIINGLQRTVQYPGEMVYNMADHGKNLGTGMLGAAGIGAGLGAAYHLGRKNLYNTPEENEEEKNLGWKPLLKRMAIPAAALSLGGGAEASMFGEKRYADLAAGAGGSK